jgi:uncharacterized protein involved in outer membrane biogenesis
MKVLRILGIGVGILRRAARGLVSALLHALFDGEKVKAELTRVVMEQKQRKLDIAGPVELAVWPEVGLRLGRVSLSEPGGKEEFAALDSARVAVAVMPLLSKQVQVRRIESQGPQGDAGEKEGRYAQHRRPDRQRRQTAAAPESRRWRHGEFTDATRHRGHQNRQCATDLA